MSTSNNQRQNVIGVLAGIACVTVPFIGMSALTNVQTAVATFVAFGITVAVIAGLAHLFGCRNNGPTAAETVVEHNLNHDVHVKVTDYGVDVWRRARLEVYSDRWRNRPVTHEDHAEFVRNFQAELDRHFVGDGWYKFQAHQLWGLFGKCFYEGMGLAAQLPFETELRYVVQPTKPGVPANTTSVEVSS